MGHRPANLAGVPARFGGSPARRGGAQRDRQRGLGGEQVEGRRSVLELLAAGRRRVREVWIAQDSEPSRQLDEIERLAARRRAKVLMVGRRRLDAAARTGSPQGVLAFAEALEEGSLEEMCDPVRGAAPFLVVLDGVSDPHNLGAILRSAECAGVTGMVLPRHRAAHVTPTVTKVAAGAIEHVPMAVVPGVPNALKRLSDRGVLCIGLDAAAQTSLFELGEDLCGAVALVLGAEGGGIGSLSRRRCDLLVAIPRQGELESLNVAAAAAVACFETARRRSESTPATLP
ncbi:MAG TPA: 23S rRNA (guanosine(2251)-2'-O)-methyltransferase RlmB [Acidimicrobiales bacterium]|nr:23S rRNA (guanosine(2251)-2'-O)-methyltransferase RlmB [Acidimicrobiales bacterium]